MAQRRYLPDLLLLLAALVWGTTFSIVKQALDHTTPFTFMAIRFGLALLVITPLLIARSRLPGRRELWGGILTGISLFIGFSFQTWGLVYTTASRSAFITGLNVVLVPFLLWGLGQRKISARRWLAAALATLGIYLLVNPAAGAAINRGDLLTLLCAVAFAGQIILLAIYAPSTDTVGYFWVQIVTVTILALGAAVGTRSLSLEPAATLWWALAITGLLGTAAAFLGMTWAQRHVSPTRTALLLATEPLFGALFAVWIAGEFLGPVAWLGGLLIVGAVVWSELSGKADPAAADPEIG